jgi:hypothetical protein
VGRLLLAVLCVADAVVPLAPVEVLIREEEGVEVGEIGKR